jgi:hypothetical protein
MAFKIVIEPHDRQRLRSQERHQPVPPTQVHKNKKAYQRRLKHKQPDYD